MVKSSEAFRTISEVADELEVPKHVLRFWELKFAQIRPMKRGGGRRFYRPEDLDLLRAIRHLLHREGYTIKGVQKILREQGVESVKQRGRAPTSAAKTRRAPAPAAQGSRPGARSRREPAEPTRASARALVSTGEVRRRILSAIAELEACQAILSDRATEAPARARGRNAAR
jgi:DNA-binding transcriptional MerR regulator